MDPIQPRTAEKPVTRLRADLSTLPPEDASLLRKILERQISERCPARVSESAPSGFTLEFRIDSALAEEAFRLESDAAESRVRISAAGKRGLLYGMGKFLRESRYEEDGGFIPAFPNVFSAPESPFRGMYLATHFGNFYDLAPLETIDRYMEDLALWGCSAIQVWFDMHHFTGVLDPAAQSQFRRLRHILEYAGKLGLDPVLTGLSNEAFAGSPPEMRADWTAGHDGYRHEPVGHYHVELCPNRPGAQKLLSQWRRAVLEEFSGTGVKYVNIFHYDQGGCTCSACAPWGISGGIRSTREFSRIAREIFPGCKTIFSLWRFDIFTSGEWDGIFKLLETPRDFADLLLIDLFDLEKVRNGSPGGLPVLCFPEISMDSMTPWGGYGANPMPAKLGSLWRKTRKILSGAMTYSEGIYEDLNKILSLQLGWDPSLSAEEILKEYFRFFFGAEPGPEFLRAADVLEKNLSHQALVRQDGQEYPTYSLNSVDPSKPWTIRHEIKASADPEEAAEILRKEELRLPARVRTSWRWRLLRLRAELDSELLRHDGAASETAERYFAELGTICLLDPRRTHETLTPPGLPAWKARLETRSGRDGVL